MTGTAQPRKFTTGGRSREPQNMADSVVRELANPLIVFAFYSSLWSASGIKSPDNSRTARKYWLCLRLVAMPAAFYLQ
jgi:hypothetical protein